MKNRIIAMALVIVMLFALSACGKKQEAAPTPAPTEAPAAPTEAPATPAPTAEPDPAPTTEPDPVPEEDIILLDERIFDYENPKFGEKYNEAYHAGKSQATITNTNLANITNN